AKDVIANSGKSLYTRDEYEKAWKQKDTKESLFELAIDDSYNPQRYALGYYTDYNGYAECGFNEEGYLFKYLKAHPEDIRSKMIKDQTGSAFAGGAQGYYPGKYPGQEGSSKPTYVNNPKIVRIAEMYLIAAEAEYYLNNVDDAIDWINELNDARIEGYDWVEPEEVEDPIQYLIDQYKIEFFTENQIAFAYWRNKRTVTAMNGVLTVPYNDKLAIFPLPQSEINCNPNLVQNEGYGR
ncbi:MAG: RagB/SusD family nutrient uptake outer membrane protein, partial [Bacteroidales bacterium]|nr:RagB/SusD family nutrient uptake outer membrane protein [Bacteroidales bacterium]